MAAPLDARRISEAMLATRRVRPDGSPRLDVVNDRVVSDQRALRWLPEKQPKYEFEEDA
jgi:hypothetical protein